ncbi:TenA family transcriptional regulator [Ktedonosporobacter rubrisoli]|uniref:Aminopyrimidine aminohydrolase n=1 Tax=Ktedonosporobacter rubrisoli TaxID=2509675 RepID=A0A4P6K5Z0_KTERU|nr:TenA family transcriptional regulator [Ktedonosporobacter rubrisoli]
MQPLQLIERHAAEWHAATHHSFLQAVSNGSLAPQAFSAWLVQDYHFAQGELAFQARLLAQAPRSDQALIINGLIAMNAELSWFESKADEFQLSLHDPALPVTVAYGEFMHGLEHAAYPVALMSMWAIEYAYLEAWKTALPGSPKYREFVERWTNPAFQTFVGELEQAAAAALSSFEADKEVDAAFLDIARLEREFWDMAWSQALH